MSAVCAKMWGRLAVMMAMVSCARASGACVNEAPCRCRTADQLLDLAPAASGPIGGFYKASTYDSNTHEVVEYFFHPCSDATLPNKDAPNTCTDTSICKREYQYKPLNANYVLTDSNYTKIFSFAKTSLGNAKEGSITISYPNNGGISALVYLACSEYSTNNFMITNPDPNNLIFTFYSPHACLVSTTTHHSLGTTLLIIFFVIVMVYMLTGVCVKHFLMGARGIEVIPNLNFWKELPALVKDGVIFIQNGFKPPIQTASTPNQNPNPNTYDSI